MQLTLLTPQRRPEFLVIDGTAMLFRAFFSGYRRAAPDGLEVGASLLACQQLQSLVVRRRPQRIAVVFDPGGRNFRHELSEDYKAHRPPLPDGLRPQFQILQDAVDALGFARFCEPGFEADDLVATLTALGRRRGYLCRLFSGDKDLHQLVRDDIPPVFQEDPRSGRWYNARAVRRRLGVRPDQVVDYLALVGDTADNVPGVRGIGPKSASALLEQFGDLETLFDNLDALSTLPLRGASTLKARLVAGREDARLARALVLLRQDVELGLTPDTLDERVRWDGPLGIEADRFFGRLGSRSALRELRRMAERQAAERRAA